MRYFLRFSDPKNLRLKYTDFSSTYLSGQLSRKTYHFKGNKKIQRYTENTLHRRKIEMVNARLLVQQFTHPVHPNSSYRLSYLLRQFVDKTGKYAIGSRQNTREKQQARQYTWQMFLSYRKVNEFTLDRPRSNCLFWSVDHAVISCCWPIGSIADSSRALACTLEAVASSLSSTPMSDWRSRIYSCSVLMQFERRKPSILVSKGKISSSSIICVSACGTPGPDPVPIAGDRGDVQGSSDSVSTTAMDRTVMMGCSPRPDVPLSHHWTALRFRVLDAVQEGIICLQDHFERCRKYFLPYLDQSTLQIINVARRRGRQKPRRVFLLRAIEGVALVTSYHPINLSQARLEFELHEGSYPYFTRPHHFVVLVLVNSRHFKKSDKKRSARVHPT